MAADRNCRAGNLLLLALEMVEAVHRVLPRNPTIFLETEGLALLGRRSSELGLWPAEEQAVVDLASAILNQPSAAHRLRSALAHPSNPERAHAH